VLISSAIFFARRLPEIISQTIVPDIPTFSLVLWGRYMLQTLIGNAFVVNI
jgi:hypothetical protein